MLTVNISSEHHVGSVRIIFAYMFYILENWISCPLTVHSKLLFLIEHAVLIFIERIKI